MKRLTLSAAAFLYGVLGGIGLAWLALPYKPIEESGTNPVTVPKERIKPHFPFFLTFREHLEIGRERLRQSLRTYPGLSAIRGTAWSAVVRIRIYQGERIEFGTGVVLEPGHLIATAAHVVDRRDGEDPVRYEVINHVGARLDAEVVIPAVENEDLALLSVSDRFSWSLKGLSIGNLAHPGAYLILGYPGKMGVLPSGFVGKDVYDTPRFMKPLGIVAETRGSSVSELTPIAGSFSLGGMSGGPVIDGEGRVVAILSGWTEHTTSTPDPRESAETEFLLRVTALKTLEEKIRSIVERLQPPEDGETNAGSRVIFQVK